MLPQPFLHACPLCKRRPDAVGTLIEAVGSLSGLFIATVLLCIASTGEDAPCHIESKQMRQFMQLINTHEGQSYVCIMSLVVSRSLCV